MRSWDLAGEAQALFFRSYCCCFPRSWDVYGVRRGGEQAVNPEASYIENEE